MDCVKYLFWVGVLTLSNLFTNVLGENCDELGITVYEDLGCVPEYGEASNCPVKYTCQGLGSWNNNQCHFRGNTYDDRQIVEDSLSSPSCDKACFCSVYKTRANFMCAVLDCPEWLGVTSREGCYETYSMKDCCSTGTICNAPKGIAKCVVDEVDYKEGVRFYPKDSCLNCICQKGFNGQFDEPFCKRRTCGIQLKYSQYLQNICAPLYAREFGKALCCPDSWIWPDGTEVISGLAKSDCDVCEKKDTDYLRMCDPATSALHGMELLTHFIFNVFVFNSFMANFMQEFNNY